MNPEYAALRGVQGRKLEFQEILGKDVQKDDQTERKSREVIVLHGLVR